LTLSTNGCKKQTRLKLDMMIWNKYKKPVISQRWPRDVPYIWVPWNVILCQPYSGL